jgi:hypothetical protein
MEEEVHIYTSISEILEVNNIISLSVTQRLLLNNYGTNESRGFGGFCLIINWRISGGTENVYFPS